MAHYYNGVDAPGGPVIPLLPTLGKGVWPAAQLTDDQDDRDAASANLGAEAAHDKANFLAWRMINIIEGGTYTFTAAIHTKNGWDFNGLCQVSGVGAEWRFKAPVYLQNDKTFYIGDPGGGGNGHILVRPNSDIIADGGNAKIQVQNGADFIATGSGSAISLQDQAHFSLGNDSTATLAGQTTQTGPYLKSGVDGWTKGRHRYANNGEIITDARAYDFIELTAIGNTGSIAVSCSITLNQPPDDAEVGISVRVFAPQGLSTSGTSSDIAVFSVFSPGVGAGGSGETSIDGAGKTKGPCYVDLVIVDAAGGTQRKWVASAASSKPTL